MESKRIVLGSQESYKLTEKGQRIAVLGNNCGKKKNEIRQRFDVSEFGSCSHPTAADADAYALSTLAPLVIAGGGVLNFELGHRAVENKVGPFEWTTYLSYAGGDTI